MNVKNGIIEHNDRVSPLRRRFDALTTADLIPPIELQILGQRSLGKKNARMLPRLLATLRFLAEILPRSSSNIGASLADDDDDDDDDDDSRELIASESVLCNLLP